ncbi:MAG TPA: glycine oxidase ThiO [bacterium]|jgi:glycine oxidase
MEPAQSLPDILIIGGGLIGCLCAYELARRGQRVAVVERGDLERESSWAGAGILSPIQPWRYPDALSALVNLSLARYDTLVPELLGATGIDPQRRPCGMVIPVFAEDEWRELDPAAAWSARFAWEYQRLEAAEARAVEPALAPDCLGADYWPDVGQVRNPRLAAAARTACTAVGVRFHTHNEVIGFRRDGDRLAAAVIADGELAADQFLLAAGAWSGGLGHALDLELPVAPVKGQILLLRTAPETVRRIVKHPAAYFVPRVDGRVLVGATMERADFDKTPTLWALRSLANAAAFLLPCLDGAEVERQWAGLRPGTPDGLPYLGRAPGYANLFVATGHYRNGVVLAPATAEVMARLMGGEEPGIDLAPFAVDRSVTEGHPLGLPAAAP